MKSIVGQATMNRHKGQSTIEYTLLVVIVAAAIMAMQLYVQRAARAHLRLIQEQINAEPQ